MVKVQYRYVVHMNRTRVHLYFWNLFRNYFFNLQYCPGGSIFDPESLNCVLNENAPCLRKILKKHFVHYIKRTFSSAGETPRTTTTTATSTTSAGPFSCLSAGSFPYPGNCSLYYICTAVGADPITVVSNLHSCSLVLLD